MLIAIEGIDGAGKTSVARALVRKLRERGLEAIYTREPLATPFINGLERFSSIAREAPELAAFAMCADRVVHVKRVIEPMLRRGIVVVTDRYFYSTIAYQGAMGLEIDWLRELCRVFPKPDLAIYLRISVDEALRRIGARGCGRLSSLFEKRSFLERVSRIFDELANSGELVVVDASKPLEKVVSECLSLTLSTARKPRLP
ncbi:MAG: dTMP kinase [Crenarchaeota archaeon]|nr:dTMP kinase [Thermoproteota archaeon]